MEIITWLAENIPDVVETLSYLFLAANIIVRLTPSPADNIVLEKLYNIFKLISVTQIISNKETENEDDQSV